MKPEETIDFHIRWAWHGIARLYNNEASKHDLTMSTGYVLLSIDHHNGTPSTKLGPMMGMEPRSLVRTLQSMEEDGLIKRKPDKDDKRVVRIFLTEKGKKKRDISKDKVILFNEYIQKKIGKKKLKDFMDVMNDLNKMINEEKIF
jgi:DNA-binding MarR family transcriptional regulator